MAYRVDSTQKSSWYVGSVVDKRIVASTMAQSLSRTIEIQFEGGKRWEREHDFDNFSLTFSPPFQEFDLRLHDREILFP